MSSELSGPCPICSSNRRVMKSAFNKAFKRKVPLAHCKDCGLYWVDMPAKQMHAMLTKYYKDEYWEHYDTRKGSSGLRSVISKMLALEYTGASSHYSYIAPFLKKYGKKYSVLDVGSGTGSVVTFFQRKGVHCLGLEPDAEQVKMTNKLVGKPVVVKGFLETYKPKKKFECVMMFHTLEHVEDVRSAMTHLFSLVAKEGYLYVEVPNCAEKNHLDDSVGTHPHTYHFSKENLAQLFEQFGFKVLSVQPFRLRASLALGTMKVSEMLEAGFFFIAWPFTRLNAVVKDKRGNMLRIVGQKIVDKLPA